MGKADNPATELSTGGNPVMTYPQQPHQRFGQVPPGQPPDYRTAPQQRPRSNEPYGMAAALLAACSSQWYLTSAIDGAAVTQITLLGIAGVLLTGGLLVLRRRKVGRILCMVVAAVGLLVSVTGVVLDSAGVEDLGIGYFGVPVVMIALTLATLVLNIVPQTAQWVGSGQRPQPSAPFPQPGFGPPPQGAGFPSAPQHVPQSAQPGQFAQQAPQYPPRW